MQMLNVVSNANLLCGYLMLSDQADVIIVGAGAAGAAAAWRLSRGGLKIICLDRGNWQRKDDMPATSDDWEILRQTRWNPSPAKRNLHFDLAIDATESMIKPLAYAAVGGSTVMWSCHFPRFHPSDFRTYTLDGVGDDWPIGYEDLLPYYAINEKMMGVSGAVGNPAYPADTPPRLPPLPLSEGARRIATSFNKLGWSWWPAELAINSVPYTNAPEGGTRGQCVHCGPCEMNCPHGAKATTDLVYWPLAIKAGVRLVTGARVTKVLTDSRNATQGIVYKDSDGSEHRLTAPIVILAANAVGSARLLHLSANRSNPYGLANRSGLVGKRLMLHPLARVTGLFKDQIDGHKGLSAGTLVSHHFYETDMKRGFRRGFKMQALGTHGPAFTASGSLGRRMPWGATHHREFERHFGYAYSLSICSDDMPDLQNQVTLSDTLIADDDLPAAKMIYRIPDDARKALDYGLGKAAEALRHAGCYDTFETQTLPDAGFHLMGTARMGHDPETSVTNEWCESHDIKGLFVIDGGAFVTAAAVNPTNTIQAISLRTADHILTRGR